MKRLLIILLLLVVPLQTGLASACGYCTHAGRADADPHALVHGSAKMQQAGVDAPDTAAAGTDTECALCHLGCGSAVAAHAALPAVDLPAATPPHRRASYDPSHLDRIDRVPLSVACSC